MGTPSLWRYEITRAAKLRSREHVKLPEATGGVTRVCAACKMRAKRLLATESDLRPPLVNQVCFAWEHGFDPAHSVAPHLFFRDSLLCPPGRRTKMWCVVAMADGSASSRSCRVGLLLKTRTAIPHHTFFRFPRLPPAQWLRVSPIGSRVYLLVVLWAVACACFTASQHAHTG